MKKRNIKKDRKSGFNSNRDCYLSSDGRHYCYHYLDPSSNRMITKWYEVGRDLSEELMQFLDMSDHDMDLNDRYERELRDPRFDAQMNNYRSDPEDTVNPWDAIVDTKNDPAEALLSEPEPENPQVVIIRRVVEEECTVAQQDLFYDHFGMETSLESIRKTEEKRIGKTLSHNAISNRKNKIIDKAAKNLGVERVKRHKCSQKD